MPPDLEDRRSRKNTISFVADYIFGGYNPKEASSCRETYDSFISEDVIQWFHSQSYCLNTTFRLATIHDIPSLLQVNTVNPTYEKQEDYETALKAKNEYIIIAERVDKTGKKWIVGMVHYYLIWYCPSHSIDNKPRRRDGLLNASDLQVIQSHKVVYVCTLQVVKPSHPLYGISAIAAQSHTGSLLFSLACQHGIHTGMSYVLCDSTDDAVSFYQQMFDMRANPRGNRSYTPMQLDLTQFQYQRFWNPLLCMIDVSLLL